MKSRNIEELNRKVTVIKDRLDLTEGRQKALRDSINKLKNKGAN